MPAPLSKSHLRGHGRRGLRLVLLLAAAAVGCRTPQPLLGPPPPPPDGGLAANTLGTGDLLEIRVYQEPDLCGVFRVSPEGVIDFPLCGRLRVIGRTATEAADTLTACLAAGFLKRPSVSVMIKEFNSKKVFVFGDVAKPGAFPFEEGMTIIHAVSQAGGFNRTAAKNSVNITRLQDGRETKILVKVNDIVVGSGRNVELVPGDIIFVPESIL